MCYDKENRLTVHQSGSSVATYAYDGCRLRPVSARSSAPKSAASRMRGRRANHSCLGRNGLPGGEELMGTTYYHTVNGEIVGETTSGVRTDYLVDALGSVTGTVNQSAQVLNTYRYKPYGALLAKTGTAADPKSQWVGTLGYRATSRAQSDYYVRARHYASAPGGWSTVDPLWPSEAAYAYASASPLVVGDAAGMQVKPPNEGSWPGCGPRPKPFPIGDWCAQNQYVYELCHYCNCLRHKGAPPEMVRECQADCDYATHQYRCCKGKESPLSQILGGGGGGGNSGPVLCAPDPYAAPCSDRSMIDECGGYGSGNEPWPVYGVPAPHRPDRAEDNWNYQDCLDCCDAAFARSRAAQSDSRCQSRDHDCRAHCGTLNRSVAGFTAMGTATSLCGPYSEVGKAPPGPGKHGK
jgi:hypothetical protein